MRSKAVLALFARHVCLEKNTGCNIVTDRAPGYLFCKLNGIYGMDKLCLSYYVFDFILL